MGVTRIEVDEYTCELCGYKWISRVNGQDRPKPKRCAKCKDQRWEKGALSYRERKFHDIIRHRFGYYEAIKHHAGWQLEDNAKRFLAARPSVEELEIVAEPMVYLGILGGRRERMTYELFEYEKELSRQNMKWLMEERYGLRYDSNELKRIEMGHFAIYMGSKLPELCEAIKEEHPEYSNENIKAEVLKTVLEKQEEDGAEKWPEERTKFLNECLECSWPDWLIAKPSN